MGVLAFGTYDDRRHPRIGVLIDGLTTRGVQVVEINRPLLLSTAQRVELLRKPWLAYRPTWLVLRAWAGLVAEAGRLADPPDVVIVGYLGQFDAVLARLVFRRSTIALDQMTFAGDTARDRGVRSRVALGLFDAIDALACRAADVVIVDTAEQGQLVPAARRDRVVVVPVGATDEWYRAGAKRPPADRQRPLQVIFFGLFTPLQGTTFIGDALGLLSAQADIEVTMVGRGQDYETTRQLAARNERVRWLDWIDPDELPEFAASHDVCLGVFGTSPKAQRVVPNKVYQGAAAGCAILTSDTAPQRRACGDAAAYVPAGDATALADALMALADDREHTVELGRSAAALAAIRFRPDAVVGDLMAVLGL